MCRLNELQTKVSDLESETDRLSQALEAQKAATIEVQTAATKKVEEVSRDLQKKVLNCRNLVALFFLNGRHNQASEIEQLRNKLRQYSDYDEIKRELEIMKVGVHG